MGTIYQDTSFAIQHKNVLIVTVDIFQWSDAKKKLSQHGAIKADLDGEHLAWFKRVLTAGRKNPSVRFIIVQAHTPTLAPFRAARTSRMGTCGMETSNICKAMRTHGVDLYLAGEVHTTTALKDPKSNLVQLITDRSRPTEITVHPGRLEMRQFDRDHNVKTGPQTKTVPYLKNSTLTIRKAAGKTTVTGSGLLAPLDPNKIFIYYPLDAIEATPIASRYFGPKLTVENFGGLGFIYDSCSQNLKPVKGVIGKAALLDSKSQLFPYAFSPFGGFGKTERTFSMWVKTTSEKTANLILDGPLGVVYQGGGLAIVASKKPFALKSAAINDGRWHHVALVVSPGAKSFDDLAVYLDGKALSWAQVGTATEKAKLLEAKHRLSIGCGAVYLWKATGPAKGPGFEGAIDEFGAWYRALSAAEINALYVGAKQGKTASQIDKTFGK